MSHHANELKHSEEDKPNTNAIYIIIVSCLVGLGLTFWGLAEYKGYLEVKRTKKIQTIQSEAQISQKAKAKAALDVIDSAIEKK